MNICVVCIANYCRSPVAEVILKNRFEDYKISSAGINPLYDGGMDLRSRNFLINNKYKPIIHTPNKINIKKISESDIVFSMDFMVLAELNRLFPKYKNKFKLFSYQFENIDLSDPYKLDNLNYLKIMKNIEYIANKIEI